MDKNTTTNPGPSGMRSGLSTAIVGLVALVAAVLSGCGTIELGGSPPITNQAAPGAKISGGGTTTEVLRGETFVTAEGHRVSYRGWTEWPFTTLDNQFHEQIGIATINSSERIVYLRVETCMERTTSTPVHQWGLIDRDGGVLNTGYTTVSFGWLEPTYRQPAEGSCAEGWLGLPIDQTAPAHSVEWSDPLSGERFTWFLGQELLAIDARTVAADQEVLDLGITGDGPGGSSWTIQHVGLAALDSQYDGLIASQDGLPPDTDWWAVTAEYCGEGASTSVSGTPELALDGWFVGRSRGREFLPSGAAGTSEGVVPTGAPGTSCLLVVDLYAVPVGMTPSHVRMLGDSDPVIWRI